MIRRILLGPFLTRSEAAAKAGLPAEDLPFRPDLIRIGGRSLPEAYCSFQFDRSGVRGDIGTVVLAMRSTCDDLTMADWLLRGNATLRGEAPLTNLNRSRSPGAVLAALMSNPPQQQAEVVVLPAEEVAAARQKAIARHGRPRLRPRYGHPATSH